MSLMPKFFALGSIALFGCGQSNFGGTTSGNTVNGLRMNIKTKAAVLRNLVPDQDALDLIHQFAWENEAGADSTPIHPSVKEAYERGDVNAKNAIGALLGPDSVGSKELFGYLYKYVHPTIAEAFGLAPSTADGAVTRSLVKSLFRSGLLFQMLSERDFEQVLAFRSEHTADAVLLAEKTAVMLDVVRRRRSNLSLLVLARTGALQQMYEQPGWTLNKFTAVTNQMGLSTNKHLPSILEMLISNGIFAELGTDKWGEDEVHWLLIVLTRDCETEHSVKMLELLISAKTSATESQEGSTSLLQKLARSTDVRSQIDNTVKGNNPHSVAMLDLLINRGILGEMVETNSVWTSSQFNVHKMEALWQTVRYSATNFSVTMLQVLLDKGFFADMVDPSNHAWSGAEGRNKAHALMLLVGGGAEGSAYMLDKLTLRQISAYLE